MKTRKSDIKEIKPTKVVESSKSYHEKALKALAEAKKLEAKTKTRAVIENGGKLVRFVRV